jgi:hypothetical protein
MADLPNQRGWVRYGPPALLLAAVAAFFWKIVTFQGALFFFDLIQFTVPIREFFFKNIAHGRFPLWSQEICGGFPLFDEGQMGPLYLPNYLLFTWLPGWWALNASAVLHAAGGALGAHFYLKRSHSAAASAIGAMTFVLAFPIVAHLVHFMFFEAACLMPWLFLFADRFLEKGRIADVLAGALVLGAMFTTGHQQGGFFIAMAFGVYSAALAAEAWAGGRRRAAVELAAAGLAMAAIAVAESAVIIHSMMRLLQQSVRHEAMAGSFIFRYSLVPDALGRLASPALHGRGMNSTWLFANIDEREVAVYLGLAAWCFAALAFAGRADRRDRAHLAVVAFGLLFMLGGVGPLAGLIAHTPLLNRMRIPPRFAMPMSLSLAFLVASGLDRLRDKNVDWRRALALLLAGAAAWAATAWIDAYAAYGFKLFARAETGNALPNVAIALRHDLALRSFLAGGLVAAALLLLALRGKRPVAQWAALAAIGALVFADLAAAGRDENPAANPSIYRPQTTLDYLAPRLDGYRIYSFESWGGASSRSGWQLDLRPYVDAIESLPVASASLFGIRTAACESPLTVSRQRRALDEHEPKWLRQFSVKYALNHADHAGGLPIVQHADRVHIFEVADPPPIYGLARTVVPVADGEAAYLAIDRHDVDVDIAFVEGAGAARLAASAGGTVTVLEEQPDFRRLRVQSDGPGFVIVRENYYPGWHAAVDGAPAPIFRTNYLFYGFPVAAGVRDVTLTYRPAGFRPMLAVSLATFLGALGLALFYRPFRRTRPALLDAPADDWAAALALLSILVLFAALLIAAIALHPQFWNFSQIRNPRW